MVEKYVIGWVGRKNLVYGPQTVGTKGKKLLSCSVNKREHSRFLVKNNTLGVNILPKRRYNSGQGETPRNPLNFPNWTQP